MLLLVVIVMMMMMMMMMQNEATCECGHNTAGQHCEYCLQLYNDRPWAVADQANANACLGICNIYLKSRD